MRVTSDSLANLDSDYKGYLEGEGITAFFKEFEIKFSAGHWCAGELSDRVCRSYTEDPNFERGTVADIRRVSEAGVEEIELSDTLFRDSDLKIQKQSITEVHD